MKPEKLTAFEKRALELLQSIDDNLSTISTMALLNDASDARAGTARRTPEKSPRR